MPPNRRTDPRAGLAAVRQWRADRAEGARSDRATTATAVRYLLEELAERAPGHTLEVRVPPYGVTQCLQGPRHTRGTPPNVIETDAVTWLALATGELAWAQAAASGTVRASGERADLSQLLPIVGSG